METGGRLELRGEGGRKQLRTEPEGKKNEERGRRVGDKRRRNNVINERFPPNSLMTAIQIYASVDDRPSSNSAASPNPPECH